VMATERSPAGGS